MRPVALKYNDRVASLGAGDLFGEMCCLNNSPRAATVRAAEDCTVLEMYRNVLLILQRTKGFKEWLEDTYRTRLLDNVLRNLPFFAALRADPAKFDQLVEYLRPRIALRRLEPDEAVFHEGDPADSFYLVRTGHIKVSRANAAWPEGEQVLDYIGPGGRFGEIGLLSDVPEIRRLLEGNKYAPGKRHGDVYRPGPRRRGAHHGGRPARTLPAVSARA